MLYISKISGSLFFVMQTSTGFRLYQATTGYKHFTTTLDNYVKLTGE